MLQEVRKGQGVVHVACTDYAKGALCHMAQLRIQESDMAARLKHLGRSIWLGISFSRDNASIMICCFLPALSGVNALVLCYQVTFLVCSSVLPETNKCVQTFWKLVNLEASAKILDGMKIHSNFNSKNAPHLSGYASRMMCRLM